MNPPVKGFGLVAVGDFCVNENVKGLEGAGAADEKGDVDAGAMDDFWLVVLVVVPAVLTGAEAGAPKVIAGAEDGKGAIVLFKLLFASD